jgi:hypothetical protein
MVVKLVTSRTMTPKFVESRSQVRNPGKGLVIHDALLINNTEHQNIRIQFNPLYPSLYCRTGDVIGSMCLGSVSVVIFR